VTENNSADKIRHKKHRSEKARRFQSPRKEQCK
jgi:hypothetical protein